MPTSQTRRAGLSRRTLLGASAVAAIGVGVRDVSAISDAEAAESPSGAGQSPTRLPIVVQVNGIERAMSVEPDMTLAEALRGPPTACCSDCRVQ
jgi:hypothetical protein